MCSLFFPKNISPEIFLIWSWTPSWVSAVVSGPNPDRPILFISQKSPAIAIRLTELLAHLGIWLAEKAQLSHVQGGVEISDQIPETGIRSQSIGGEYRKPLPRAVRSGSAPWNGQVVHPWAKQHQILFSAILLCSYSTEQLLSTGQLLLLPERQ